MEKEREPRHARAWVLTIIAAGLWAFVLRTHWIPLAEEWHLLPRVVLRPLANAHWSLLHLAWLALVPVGLSAVVQFRAGWVRGGLATLAMLLAAWMVTWGPNLTYGARASFAVNREHWTALVLELEEERIAAEQVGASTPPGQYYIDVPAPYAHLTYEGKMSSSTWGYFFPLWAGIPDDAGGLWYSPRRSPEGLDMWGLQCNQPTDLGNGWWGCGIAP